MKIKMLIASAVIAASMNSTAQETNYCADLASLSGQIMESRQQSGESIVDAINVFDKLSEDAKFIGTTLVIEAYKRPRFSSDEYKENSVSEFESQVYLSCIEGAE